MSLSALAEDSLQRVTLLTVAEVAQVLRVSKMTVYRLLQSDQLQAARVGRGYRVPDFELARYLREAYGAELACERGSAA